MFRIEQVGRRLHGCLFGLFAMSLLGGRFQQSVKLAQLPSNLGLLFHKLGLRWLGRIGLPYFFACLLLTFRQFADFVECRLAVGPDEALRSNDHAQ